MVQLVQRNRVRCALKHIPTSVQSLHLFLERWALQVALYPGKRDMTELHSATPHIDRVCRIYQETLLQYFLNTWVSAACSDISRCTNCTQNPQMRQIPLAFILPLSPLSTTLRYPFSTAPVPKFQPASGKPRPRAGVVKFEVGC